MARFISISGNIGAGKTTLINMIKEAIPGCHVMPERLHLWNHDNILARYYSNKKKYAEEMQQRILDDYSDAFNNIPETGTFVMERCHLDVVMIFCAIGHSNGEVSSKAMADFEKQASSFRKPDTLIYLNTDANTCIDRIDKRGRNGEDMISSEYILQLDAAHKNMYGSLSANGYNCKIINNNNFESVAGCLA
eukprot:CAMPEP_0194165150 /NCGR_PEP_ID=MMETSP0154-20130528/1162_1 /TAXON_ID=1049557 /ORGANISM="Thalassiothrix antarctica, Strain L6-D1" /LENGTH=191 /DNA_ID=CAMNT_0038875521 /DNA_START=84 /DNA_END=659 /DNA_ORIENTATION=+